MAGSGVRGRVGCVETLESKGQCARVEARSGWRAGGVMDSMGCDDTVGGLRGVFGLMDYSELIGLMGALSCWLSACDVCVMFVCCM